MPAFPADTANGCSRHVKDAFLQHTRFCGGSLGAAEPCGGCEGAAAAAPDDTSLMDWFIANAQPHFLAITTKSEALFKENDATFLLPDINFTQLW